MERDKDASDEAAAAFDRLTRLLKVPPDQAQRMRGLRSVRGTISVELRPGEGLRGATAGSQRNPWIEQALEELGPEVRARLSEVENRVLEWIEASPANAQAFTEDPLASIKHAVPDLDDATISAIRDIRVRNSGKSGSKGVSVTKVSLKVDRKKKNER